MRAIITTKDLIRESLEQAAAWFNDGVGGIAITGQTGAPACRVCLYIASLRTAAKWFNEAWIDFADGVLDEMFPSWCC